MKMKTKKIVRKRFKITKTGKVMHGVQGARHLRSRKTKRHQRRQDLAAEITNVRFSRMIKQFMSA
ncbi:MAG: 50S ribosomal protein L35 [Candidatus Gottesmanbacteria bacterium GW2011_GWA2_47_9]|uniref:50S ribosomal protein L35 n=2 Tax=Candidatus Gottesmaniibacteriota TaxID=1752720 RepID=A0A0G1UMT9_9BACT|nr:MAG: 50S ribosomal protein L35 [Candidatus Gottesmanbacteria bacterium GW2011_GWA2_47_9]KKU95454.1 MAG: 50S ribosomal protein L35 [Candidatus Gottesmanbacteria bacterium GW2011_GWA1_48_13]